jgi:hypothetical protein
MNVMSAEDCESAAADLKQPDAMAKYEDEELEQVASHLRDRVSELTHDRNYRRAKNERALIDAISQELQQRKLDAATPAPVDEPTAEDREADLDQAYQARQGKLDASWAGKERAMQRRQTVQVERLDDIWAQEYRRRSQKRSSRLLNMDYIEEHLGYAQDFDGAEVVRGEVDDLEMRETADAQESLNSGYEMAQRQLKTDHIAERALFHQTKEHWDQVNAAWREARLCTIDNRARVLAQKSEDLVPQREDSARIIVKRPPPVGAKVQNRRDKANNPPDRLLPPLLRPNDRANDDAKRRRRLEQRDRNQKFRERQEQKAKQADSSARRGCSEQQPDTHEGQLSEAPIGEAATEIVEAVIGPEENKPEARLESPAEGAAAKNDVEEEEKPQPVGETALGGVAEEPARLDADVQESQAAVNDVTRDIANALVEELEPQPARRDVQESPAATSEDVAADASRDQRQEEPPGQADDAIEALHPQVEYVIGDMADALVDQQTEDEATTAEMEASHAEVESVPDDLVDGRKNDEPGGAAPESQVSEPQPEVEDVMGDMVGALVQGDQEPRQVESAGALDEVRAEVEDVMGDMIAAPTEPQQQAEAVGQESPAGEPGQPEQRPAADKADAQCESEAPEQSVETSEAPVDLRAESPSQEQSREEAGMGALDSAFGDMVAELVGKLPGADEEVADEGEMAPRSDTFQLTQWQEDQS